MSAVKVPAQVDDTLDAGEFDRAWHGAPAGAAAPAPVKSAQLTVLRNASADFQDRQVFLFVDEEPWGKVRYGRSLSREIAPGRHRVRAFNTLWSHTIEIDAAAGEEVRLQCSNRMPRAGWLMMIFLHVTALTVRLERIG